MAHDWIKMRIGLEDDPAVIFIGKLTKLEPDHVCGKLLNLWGWADQNSTDGRLNGVSPEWIDKRVGKRGFAKAMAQVQPPWLLIDETGVTIPNFDRHNGASAKRRMCDTERKRLSRNQCDNLRTTCGQKRDQRREEKRREDIPSPPTPPANTTEPPTDPIADFKAGGEEALLREGVAEARPVIAAMAKHGATLAELDGVLAYWRAKAPAWGPGALVSRLLAWRPGQTPESLWPEPSPEAVRQQSRDETSRNAEKLREVHAQQRAESVIDRKRIAELETKYGGLLDSMPDKQIRAFATNSLGDDAPHLLKRYSGGHPTGTLRQCLLAELEKEVPP